MPVKVLKIQNDRYKEVPHPDIVDDLKKQGYILSREGLLKDTVKSYLGRPAPAAITREYIDSNLELFKKCETIVQLLVRKNIKQHLVGSYSFKHVVECLLKEHYITNGEIILIMLWTGYGLQHDGGSSPNCSFSCTYSNSDLAQSLVNGQYGSVNIRF